MLMILRTLFVFAYSVLVCLLGIVWCLFSPRHPRHVATFSHAFGWLHHIFGIRLEIRKPTDAAQFGNAIYIANHQNNFDMITASNIVQPNTVTIGKRSLIWFPLFGLLYWITGNLLIDRDNKSKAHSLITEVVDKLQNKHISFWMFPEGTRSRGRGLLPFKTGAFHAAIAAGVPVIPIVVSSTHDRIKFNRFNNGLVIIEMLPPIDIEPFKQAGVRKLTTHCRDLMQTRLEQLNEEVARREQHNS